MGLPTQIRSCSLSILCRQLTERLLLKEACVVFVGVIACGLHTPNSSTGHGLEASATSISNSETTVRPNTDDNIKQGIPTVPKFVPADLSTPDPKARLHALDHWDGTNTQIPLSAVFAATEDEDEAVRVRAIAIIEQQCAIEEHIIEHMFSMTRSTGDQLITRRPR